MRPQFQYVLLLLTIPNLNPPRPGCSNVQERQLGAESGEAVSGADADGFDAIVVYPDTEFGRVFHADTAALEAQKSPRLAGALWCCEMRS
jgi:hypothetical protein